MITVDLNKIELAEFKAKEDEKQHCRATFPLLGTHGSKELASVYFELEPGDHLGSHTDSAEELLIILEGQVSAQVGNEVVIAKEGGLVLVPKMMPHNIKNIGSGKVKVLGVFGGANNIVATFDKELIPTGTNIVDTAMMN